MIKKMLALPCIFLMGHANAWLCPNNFNTINQGDAMPVVIAACGKPTVEKKMEGESNAPQEWQYYVEVNPPNPNTIKFSVVIANKKVVSMVSNAMSLTTTSVCGSTISIGDSMDAVRSACGNPMFINKGQSAATQKPSEIYELTYQGPAPNTLVFENGLLKERK